MAATRFFPPPTTIWICVYIFCLFKLFVCAFCFQGLGSCMLVWNGERGGGNCRDVFARLVNKCLYGYCILFTILWSCMRVTVELQGKCSMWNRAHWQLIPSGLYSIFNKRANCMYPTFITLHHIHWTQQDRSAVTADTKLSNRPMNPTRIYPQGNIKRTILFYIRHNLLNISIQILQFFVQVYRKWKTTNIPRQYEHEFKTLQLPISDVHSH